MTMGHDSGPTGTLNALLNTSKGGEVGGYMVTKMC